MKNGYYITKELTSDSLYELVCMKDGKMTNNNHNILIENFRDDILPHYHLLAKWGLVRYTKTKTEHTFHLTDRGISYIRENFHRIYDKVFRGTMKYYLQSSAYTDFLKWVDKKE